jgi:hypothetical protein
MMTWSEIRQIEGEGRSSYTQTITLKDGVSIEKDWILRWTLRNPTNVQSNVHAIDHFLTVSIC